ncbi:hypothetical protein [Geobacillus sp. BK01]|uniref:hypothetical protein n=1 Tax=Geobacillus sp. BK01 TaxID=3457328 RepID=UPI003FA53DBF
MDQRTIDTISSQIVAERVERLGNATSECFAGMDLLKDVAKQYVQCDPKIKQGRLFEIIESTKFNIDAARAGEIFRAFTTDSLGDPHAAEDIVIQDSFHILKSIQAKSSDSASRLARMVANPKYGEMDRLVNTDKAERVAQLVKKRADSKSIYAQDYEQAFSHITSELRYGQISSGGTSYEEALCAAKNPNSYALEQKVQHFVSNMYSAMVNGALAGAVVGLGSGMLHGSVQVIRGEKDIASAAKGVGKTTIQSACRAAVTSGVAHGIKFISKNFVLIRGNAAVALASSAVTLTELTYKFVKGNIKIEDYLEQIGENAVSTFSGILLSAAGGLLLGPLGAAAAATVGIVGMKQLYQSFLSAQKDLRLTKEERQRAEHLSALLTKQIQEEEKLIVSFYRQSGEVVEDLIQLVNKAIYDDSQTAYAITQLATKMGVFIKYSTKDTFDEFMLGDEPLVL